MNKPAVALPLSDRPDEPALAAMFEALQAQDKEIQADAARGLAGAACADNAVIARLLTLLAGARPRARWGAAYALALSRVAPALDWQPALRQALATPDGDVRWAAADLLIALGRRYPTAVERTLLELLADPVANRRKMALYCIRDLGLWRDAVTLALRDATGDPSVEVRLAALAAIKRTVALSARAGDEPAARKYRESMEQRVLELMADDPAPAVRRTAAALVVQLDQSSPAIQAALRAAASDPALRKIVAGATN
jgi:HEAT repeat protein